MDDVSHLLDSLNPRQREAVSTSGAHVLVLAGAGAGKTRVLVHRIAWLLQVEQLQPGSVLAVTFTNKAAREMKTRTEDILGQSVSGMWIGTFHGLAHRFLRIHWQEAGVAQQFQILDGDDQLRLIKRILKTLELDETRWPPRQIQGYINRHKDEGRRPHHLDDRGDVFERQMIGLYHDYQDACARGGMLDFAELLLRAHEVLRERPALLHHYQMRFRALLVDEFQDTNAIQYAWLRLLAGERGGLFLVGDDDQSIYGWRGARVENIQRFTQDYPNTQVVRLEQNYRSSGNILAAANALIAHNATRLGKELWTTDGAGEPLRLYTAFNEIDEARFVAERVHRYATEEGLRRADCAILYRTSAQSRLFEEALMQLGLPYRVYGGQKFFERAEIKDALAYLRLLFNPHDDAACERVLNVPPRGIGARTLDVLRTQARDARVSLWQGVHEALSQQRFAARASRALQQFVDLIQQQQRHRQDQPGGALPDLISQVINASALPEYYQKAKDGRGTDRIENLEQLIEAARRFEGGLPADEAEPLGSFLAHAALEAGEAQADEQQDAVQLMTLHSAKGLEFPVVFVTGLEDGLFPHSMCINDPHQLEEERRLCYVGLTRAMRQLYLCHAESRRLHGRENYPKRSRFLRELPRTLIEDVRACGGRQVVAPRVAQGSTGGDFELGDAVVHPKFGLGVVLNSEGSGQSARIQVNFETAGLKWLVLAYARLQHAG